MFKLLWIRLRTDIWNFAEYLQVLFFYYSNWAFAKADLHLLRSYLSQNPYRMSKEFLIKKGSKFVDAYGETPLTTMDTISSECRLDSNDIVYELGCGRGRTCFWLHALIGCTVYGIDYIPGYIKIAQSVKRKYQTAAVKFICEDYLKTDFEKATVVYFYGTAIEEAELEMLCERLARLPSNVKIITISFPLADYHRNFKTIKVFKVKFPWGITDAYLQYSRQIL